MTWADMKVETLAKHIIEVAPKSAKVVFENDVVRVIEITMKKRQEISMHSHNKGLMYSLNKGKIRVTPEGGKPKTSKLKKGDVSWGAESHSVENLGGKLRELYVEIKGQAQDPSD